MSHATYQNKWTECMQELMEQVQIEWLPADAAENGQSFPQEFQHFALLYIKYLQIYRKLEDCHDQMVHPQKRRSIKKVLKSTIIRILELKNMLIICNPEPRKNNRFVALDEVLTDLKLNPETVDWKVPRYFLDDKECREEIEDKLHKIDHWLNVFTMQVEPQDLIDKKDPFEVGLTTDQAVSIIQKNERGRTGILRAGMVCEWRRDALRKEERQRKQAEKGDQGTDDLLESQILAATRIAAHWKRRVDRRRFIRMREDEFEFLGMAPARHDQKGLVKQMTMHRDHRQKMQQDADDVYEKALKEQLEIVHKKKGSDIKADLLEERRQWILDFRQDPAKFSKFPAEFDEFYNRFDKEADDEEAGEKGKDAKKDTKGDKKAAKGKDKGKGGEADEGNVQEIGPTAVVQQFVEQINQYTETWENRDESNNFDQRHDVELARKSVFPIVEAELRAVVDEAMKEELTNLKAMFEKVKKGKKGKGGKKKGAKKPKGPKVKKWCPAVGTCCNNPTEREDCVPYLVQQGILKKIKPCHLEEFLGEYEYLGAMKRCLDKYCPPPSAQMIRSLIVEHCVLPLAATDIRQKAPELLTAKSLLLYGPKGSGKSMLARAIATETGSTFFDMSPVVIEGKPEAKGANAKLVNAQLVYKVYCCAQDMAPSVIYIDQVEQVFMKAAKKKGGGAAADAPNRIMPTVIAAIKQIKRGAESTEQDRILFIGCTSRPFEENVNTAELMKSFDEKVWVSFPEYGSRVMLWQKFMEAHGVFIDPTKLNSTLASVSEGYSTGSIKQTIDRVLTERRVQQLKNRPLKVQEFLGPLSRTAFCWMDDNNNFRDFDFEATGEKERFEARQSQDAGAEGDAAKGGKKGK